MSDPFDDVLNIEGGFYEKGYQQGVEDGDLAGRIEGRQFGMGTGFDKFFESGRLAGKATVWINRMPREPARKLLPQILPVPCAVMAAAELRRRRRLASCQGSLRLPQDCGLRLGQDGGGAYRWDSPWSHHQLECHAHAPSTWNCREVDASES